VIAKLSDLVAEIELDQVVQVLEPDVLVSRDLRVVVKVVRGGRKLLVVRTFLAHKQLSATLRTRTRTRKA
jgi:hypothetical protein